MFFKFQQKISSYGCFSKCNKFVTHNSQQKFVFRMVKCMLSKIIHALPSHGSIQNKTPDQTVSFFACH